MNTKPLGKPPRNPVPLCCADLARVICQLAGVAGIGAGALTGDVSALIAAIKSYPMLVPPVK
eukprot:7405286-Pyramimonas_sp.AAC.1